jgi:ribonuclease-3
MSGELKALEDVIGHRFKSPDLLKEALSHKSHASESRSGIYNERLEFLGDSILAAVVAHELYVSHPSEDEGHLSKRKSQLVSRASLAHWASEINLGAYLLLGVGEETSGGRIRQSLLSNAFEALIGAIFLDGGYAAAERFIKRSMYSHEPKAETDYKSRLQEVLQKKFKVPPAYETTQAQGPDHDKTFEVIVQMSRKVLGKGVGKTKKEAEQAAAKNALDAMKGEFSHGL